MLTLEQMEILQKSIIDLKSNTTNIGLRMFKAIKVVSSIIGISNDFEHQLSMGSIVGQSLLLGHTVLAIDTTMKRQFRKQ